MPRSKNAQLAVDLYDELQRQYNWTAGTAWHGIARLLLYCEIYINQQGWKPFKDVVVYVDSDRFTDGDKGPHVTLRRAENLSGYLAGQLGVDRGDLCATIGRYWHAPHVRNMQPNNLVGNAFRSLVARILQRFGDPEVTYEEEVSPHSEFPGHQFPTRSKRAKIDIIARRGHQTVAVLTVRWRFRHDRLDVVDEAIAYAHAARRQNPNSHVYAVIGEFDGGRLRKVLDHCAPIDPNPALSAAVHFAPQLIREGLQENGTLKYLQSLEWLIGETFRWK
jgi:hypothetical protein